MAVAVLDQRTDSDLGQRMLGWEERYESGKALRAKVPRESLAAWKPPASRPDPLALLAQSNADRQEHLVPLRMGRMSATPFAFLRGAACVMACDLSEFPVTGIPVAMDGDAHVNNFGLYGTPQHDVAFDLNDFDEAYIGPWEWDLRRLVASVNVAARAGGLSRRKRAEAVKRCVRGYRDNMRRLRTMGVLDTWYLHYFPGRDNPLLTVDPAFQAIVVKAMAKAMRTDNHTLLPKVAEQTAKGWEFIQDPPVLTRVHSDKQKVIEALNDYSNTLSPERRFMLRKYSVEAVAHRVVGVGSVGTRAFLVLLMGNGNQDPLFLQVKEAPAAAAAPYLPPLPPELMSNNGRRVIMGQRALQASSDPMLGYTSLDGRDYYVRQMKNLKASIPMEMMTGAAFKYYVWVCGAILARAHGRTGDPARISGYFGSGTSVGDALAEWAEAYGDQTERDHERLVGAVKRGEVKAILEGDDDGA